MQVFEHIENAKNKQEKLLAVLIDPDKIENIKKLFSHPNSSEIDCVFVGGSLMTGGDISDTISIIKSYTNKPVIIFPGSTYQVSKNADAILFLSLISGRNADLLIGKHVESAVYIKRANLETIPTGYMLIDSGQATTASYISNTSPIPSNKPEIAACTALAGEMLGLKAIYMDGGSGAKFPISTDMINAVKKVIECPLIVGGGIRTSEQLKNAWEAGADIAVIGNALETNPELLSQISQIRKEILA